MILMKEGFGYEYFNSHAHVERDIRDTKILLQNLKISTHTLTWSVTMILMKEGFGYEYFNSHAHVERDRDTKILLRNLKISTHTLTWSVTSWSKD